MQSTTAEWQSRRLGDIGRVLRRQNRRRHNRLLRLTEALVGSASAVTVVARAIARKGGKHDQRACHYRQREYRQTRSASLPLQTERVHCCSSTRREASDRHASENAQRSAAPAEFKFENSYLDQHQTYNQRDIYYDTAFQQSDLANAGAFSGRKLQCRNRITSLVCILERSAVMTITGTQKRITHKVAAAEQLTKSNARMTRIHKKTTAQKFV